MLARPGLQRICQSARLIHLECVDQHSCGGHRLYCTAAGTLPKRRARRTSSAQALNRPLSNAVIEEHRLKLTKIGEDLGVKTLEDWYSVPVSKIARHSLGSFLRVAYNTSLHRALQTVYPQHEWQPWLFANPPKNIWKDSNTIKAFLQYVEQNLKLEKPSDWLTVSWQQLYKLGGLRLHRQGVHISHHLRLLYPEHRWDPRDFVHVEIGEQWWSVADNRRSALDSLETQLHIGDNNVSAWHSVTMRQISQVGGLQARLLLKVYHNDLAAMLNDLRPQFRDLWRPWLFRSCPRNWWESNSNAREWLYWVMLQMGLKSPQLLQLLTWRQWCWLGGKRLLRIHGDSVLRMLQWALPELNAETWTLRHQPRNKTSAHTADDQEADRRYLSEVASKLGVQRWPEDWYSISYDDLARVAAQRGGSHDSIVSQKYGYSLGRALSLLFPEFQWDLAAFAQVGRGAWANPDLQRRELQRVATKLFGQERAIDLAAWYSVSDQDLSSVDFHDISYLVRKYYGGSLSRALMSVYPDHPWLPSEFQSSLRIPSGTPPISIT